MFLVVANRVSVSNSFKADKKNIDLKKFPVSLNIVSSEFIAIFKHTQFYYVKDFETRLQAGELEGLVADTF
jgi:hypothetical protein